MDLLGRNEIGDRMAVAKLQVLWPLICAQLVYGLLKRRAEALGLDFKEVQRWWGRYSHDGVAGCVTSGVQQHWKANLHPLESVLAEEREEWKAAQDTSFVDALAEMRSSGSLGPLRRPEGAERLPYAVLPEPGKDDSGVRRVAGLTQAETDERARVIARARFIVISPLLGSVPTDAALEMYAHSHGTCGASLRNWLASYFRVQSVDGLMPSRVYEKHTQWAEEVAARTGASLAEDQSAQIVGIALKGPTDQLTKREAPVRARHEASQEIGRLRRVAVEQFYLRKGDSQDDHWTEEGGEKALAWYLFMKTERPETLRLWCRSYEGAVRKELLRFTKAGSIEIASLLRAIFNRNLVPLKDLGWSEQRISEAVGRGRAAGARGVAPIKVTSSMVQELQMHQAAMKDDSSEQFIEKARRRIVFD